LSNVYRSSVQPRVLILYFSLSGQTRGLVNLFAAGLRSRGVSVTIEQIRPQEKIGFPLGSILRTMIMMLRTFFRARVPIQAPSRRCFNRYDLVVLAGPTWSYNPSGPILSLLDRYGRDLFTDRRVLPLISCRGYYRWHNRVLHHSLQRFTDTVEESIIFCHPSPEPWSTIGVFLKAAGCRPERRALLGTYYRHHGHSREQLLAIRDRGATIGQELVRRLVLTDAGHAAGSSSPADRPAHNR
jgi:hypothetical protein